MNTNYAKKQIIRGVRNVFILSIILIGIIGALLFTQSANITNLYGSRAMLSSPDEITKRLDQRSTYVELLADEFFDSSYTLKKDGKDINKYYVCLFDDDKYIICKTDMKITKEIYENYKLEGKIVKPDSISQKTIDRTIGDTARKRGISTIEIEKNFSPYMLDLTQNRMEEQIICGLGYLAIAFFIFNALLQLRFLGAYHTNKWYKKLAALDPMHNADHINEMISREYDAGEYVYKLKNMVLMKNWALFPRFSGFTVQKTSDLLWIYKTITQHRTNGIPTGKSFNVTLRFRDKFLYNLVSKKKNVDDTLLLIKQNYPHVYFGYSDQLLEIFNHDPEEFIRVIKEFTEKTDD